MKTIALILFVIGVVFLVMGYTELDMKQKEEVKKIEYRYVPRTVYDDIGLIEVSDKYNDMFVEGEPISNRRLIPTNLI